MKVLYFGKFCDTDIFKLRESKEQPFFVAQYMYEKALYEQIKNDTEIDIEVISIYQTEYFPKDNFVFSKDNSKLNIKYLKFLNLPFIREISYFVSASYHIIKWAIKNKDERSKCIYSSCHFPPVSAAVVFMSRVIKIRNFITFTDLSVFTYSQDRINQMKHYKRMIMGFYLRIINHLQKSYDNYILFSEEMNAEVNKYDKPYIVVEGIYNGDGLDLNERKKQNAIAHAGTLNKEVGIEKILEVFELLEDKSVELWLIGKGDMEQEIIDRARKDKRIKYFGFIPREQVFEKLKEVKLLISLRNPDDIYTKYSFPSKMFEYMVSGTPVLSTKLNGIPNEYYDYIFTVDSYNSIIIKDIINKILSKKQDELNYLGHKAQKYIINNKNPKLQINKIKRFLYGNN